MSACLALLCNQSLCMPGCLLACFLAACDQPADLLPTQQPELGAACYPPFLPTTMLTKRRTRTCPRRLLDADPPELRAAAARLVSGLLEGEGRQELAARAAVRGLGACNQQHQTA